MNSVHFIVAGAVALLVFFVAVFGFQPKENEYDKASFLRIHIRANSNTDIDQGVKYEVKSAVVDFLTPLLCDATTKKLAMDIVNDNLDGIENVADEVLRLRGFDYQSTAGIMKENFPTRQYDDVVLEAGVYDALILNLGSGQGNNWWCVVYPPLCFVGGVDNGSDNIEYRSKLVDIINKFF